MALELGRDSRTGGGLNGLERWFRAAQSSDLTRTDTIKFSSI